MSRRIRITGKRRHEVDLDKFCFALLRIVEADQKRAKKQPRRAGREDADGKESAA